MAGLKPSTTGQTLSVSGSVTDAKEKNMLKKTNIVTVLLIAIGITLSFYHFVMGYGLGNHFYVGISGGLCIVLGLLIHRVFAVAK